MVSLRGSRLSRNDHQFTWFNDGSSVSESLSSLRRFLCCMTFMFAALLLSSADRAEAHVMHTMTDSPAAFTGAMAFDGMDVFDRASVDDFGAVAFPDLSTGAEMSQCDRNCCSPAACWSVLIEMAQGPGLLFALRKVAGFPSTVTAAPNEPEGLRRPPRHLI